jgi:hypothetical protein
MRAGVLAFYKNPDMQNTGFDGQKRKFVPIPIGTSSISVEHWREGGAEGNHVHKFKKFESMIQKAC